MRGALQEVCENLETDKTISICAAGIEVTATYNVMPLISSTPRYGYSAETEHTLTDALLVEGYAIASLSVSEGECEKAEASSVRREGESTGTAVERNGRWTLSV